MQLEAENSFPTLGISKQIRNRAVRENALLSPSPSPHLFLKLHRQRKRKIIFNSRIFTWKRLKEKLSTWQGKDLGYSILSPTILREKRVRVFAGRSEKKRKDLRIPPRRQLLGYRKP